MFCRNWRTPFYATKVRGCVMLDSTSNINSALAVGDYMFCPDMKTIKSWTTEDELKYRAFFQKPGALEDLEYEVLKWTMKQRELRLSLYPWCNTGPIKSGGYFRRLQDNGAITRRRSYASSTSYTCFGGDGGKR